MPEQAWHDSAIWGRNPPFRHPGEGRNPEPRAAPESLWVPACAGMTMFLGSELPIHHPRPSRVAL
jgi:hypothetical protein